jgi:serine/threonine protein kinase
VVKAGRHIHTGTAGVRFGERASRWALPHAHCPFNFLHTALCIAAAEVADGLLLRCTSAARNYTGVLISMLMCNCVTVAIKIVDKMCGRFDVKLLESEISTMMQCEHPNCVALFQVFDEPEKTYMVMELLTGGNVMDRIVELDHCSEQLTSHVVQQVLTALKYLHSIGITHRDLKPENLLYASADPESEKYNTIKLASAWHMI